MLSDFFHSLRGVDQLRYFRHTHSPFSPWKDAVDELVTAIGREVERYGIRSKIDRRRAYQVARMVVANRQGDHLSDVVPDAYLAYSPPSAATYHAGKKKYDAPAARRQAFLDHPQTLAYLLTPAKLARLGVGSSPFGGLVVIEAGEEAVTLESLMSRLQHVVNGKAADADLRAYAEVVLRLHAGIAEVAAEEPAAA